MLEDKESRMKVLITGVLLLAAATASADDVFQSHDQDGKPFMVATCTRTIGECQEKAYQYCQGPYKPLDQSIKDGVFNFVCVKAKRDSK